MQVSVDVSEEGAAPEIVSLEGVSQDSVAAIADRLAAKLELDPVDVAEALEAEHGLNRQALVSELKVPHLRLRRVCVEVHFEGETARHKFPPRTKWARVHRWACRHFDVASDACANLELRDGAPDGPRLNEGQPIGAFAGCRAVWLIKPGPEPYGGR